MAEAARKLPVKTERNKAGRPAEWQPFADLRRQVDRLFDDFVWGSWGLPAHRNVFDTEPFWRGELSWAKAPVVDVADQDGAYEITAELPGMDASNIAVKFADGVLTIEGEKKEDKKEKRKEYVVSERRYGAFHRSLHVPNAVDANKIAARFKNGVLTVTLPKSANGQQNAKKITVKAA
ncbi:MAG TPA: Hsp20/alpha crystallin family protein [Xanthobacteraceae bacterium]|nr:Hsp20/alpha crystallin family protein [Xanthobacteraceae bacterium]